MRYTEFVFSYRIIEVRRGGLDGEGFPGSFVSGSESNLRKLMIESKLRVIIL